MNKRLFIFASYDKDGIVDESLLYYLRALSVIGDIIFYMDSDASDGQLNKVKQIPNVIFIKAKRHGEYDFGSYKRGFFWAKEQDVLKDYNWVYLLNDSVYGPIRPLGPILEDLESRGKDVIGMCKYHNSDENELIINLPDHVQSWFFGLSKNIATGTEFFEFISGIEHQNNKMDIVYKYEGGLTNLIRINNLNIEYFMGDDKSGFDMLEKPVSMLTRGMPFIKKQSLRLISNINILGAFIFDKDLLNSVYNNIYRCKIKLGDKYKKKFRFTLFGLPIISVKKKFDDAKWKMYLFDIIPVAIIYRNNYVK